MLYYYNQGRRQYGLRPVQPYQRRLWEFQAVLSGAIRPIGPVFNGEMPRSRCLWLFRPDNVHGWSADSDSVAKIAVFHFSEVPGSIHSLLPSREWAAVTLQPEDVDEIHRISRIAELYFQEHNVLSALQFRLLLDRLSILFAERFPEKVELPANERSLMLLARAEAVLRNEAETLLSIQELADRLGVSIAHLRRIFIKHRGYPPQKAREAEIMERARIELATTDKTVLEVAISLGYAGHSAFTKAYRRYWHAPPSSARQ